MNKVKSFFRGLRNERRRIRWIKGEELTKVLYVVLAYAVVIGLILVGYDYIVIKVLNWINFS
ncbi:MAG: preprotein translocase subunit SecE [Bacilli bacterium]|jgi:preprotein translocase SecE subunit|nr:preprotein translocase subunit SecE [Bacilli bacterium]MDD3422867.1 preprotein translocase subunit SecE [Bacilli bacterium]MDD4065930.1 preprotein translocase subunit SecE [Bacilli bacterium]